MADEIKFEIVTQVSAVYAAAVASVTLPGANGELQVLPGHLPFLTLIRPGTVIAKDTSGTERTFAVSEGYAEVSDNEVTLIVADCVGAEDIDIEDARARFRELEASVAAADFRSAEELAAESERMRRVRARIDAFERAVGSRRAS